MASRLGVKDEQSFEKTYWKVFDQFFGPGNSAIVKAMLLAKYAKADTGTGELDRVCFGLRQTMAWLAEAIEKRALMEMGLTPPSGGAPTPARARRVTGRRTSPRPGSPSSR